MNASVHPDHCFGELLRQEREQRGITLEDISASTKVTVRSLRALESERFDQLPGGILSKGIARGYIRYLGLNEEEWIRRYLEAYPKPASSPETQSWASFALNISRNRAPSEHSPHLRWTGVGVLLLLLASLGWFVWSYLHTRTASAQSFPPTISTTSTIDAGAGSGAEDSSPTPVQPLAAKSPRQSHHLSR